MNREQFYKVFESGEYLPFLAKSGSVEQVVGFEKHHIYPKSFESGKIDEGNLVWVTPENHIKAHILLVRDFENKELKSDRDYGKALKAVNITCNTRWENLTESQKQELVESIPDIYDVRKKAMQKFLSEKLEKQRKEGVSPNWGCVTAEARNKAKKTVREKYGRDAGYFFTPEAVKNNKAARIRKYGCLTCNMLSPESRKKAADSLERKYGVRTNFRREEVKEKARNTIKVKYGSMTACMNLPNVKAKNKQIHEERYGSMTALMCTPEARAKAKQTRKETDKLRRLLVNSEKFQNWFRGKEKDFRARTYAIPLYLKENKLTLKEATQCL